MWLNAYTAGAIWANPEPIAKAGIELSLNPNIPFLSLSSSVTILSSGQSHASWSAVNTGLQGHRFLDVLKPMIGSPVPSGISSKFSGGENEPVEANPSSIPAVNSPHASECCLPQSSTFFQS